MKLIAVSESSCGSEEWPALLDVTALRRSGWEPQAIRQFVLKVVSRCNLACDYCYVYRSVDQLWRHQPVRMSEETVRAVADRIAEHARAHSLPTVEVVLHGGEPMLAGPAFLSFVAETMRSAIERDGCVVELALQSNATLLDDRMLRVLAEHRIRVSMSFDGSPEAHDAHRVHPNGKGSYAETVEAIHLLQDREPHLFAGLICVVDVTADPVATYENLLAFRPPAIDLLLPHANWSSTPPRPPGASPVAYGEWLLSVFHLWYGAPSRATSVRYFDEILGGLLGRSSRVETIGLSPVAVAVVETNGDIEQTDALKSTYEGASRTGLDVRRHSFDALLGLPQIAARQLGVEALCPKCQGCDLRQVCGGGFYPHRYKPREGFLNPSVYCADIEYLVRQVAARVQHDVTKLRSSQHGGRSG